MPEEQRCAAQTADVESKPSVVGRPQAFARARWAERVFVFALCVYAVLALLAHRYAYFEWDLRLAREIQSLSIPGFGAVMTAVSFLGNGWLPWLLVVLVGVAFIRSGYRAEGAVCLLAVSLGWVVNRLLKLFIGRPRPTGALVNVTGTFSHESFPSGHVVFFVEFFGYLFFLAYVLLRPGRWRRASFVVLGVLIALIGVSRVYLGAHWPSDVAGAYLAGGIWLMLSIEFYRRVKARSN